MKHRTLVRVVLLVFLGLVAVSLAGLQPEARLQAQGTVISPEVLDALQANSEVPVMISLVGPGVPLSDVTLSELQQTVAQQQDSVLAALTASDLTLTYKYQNVTGLAGRITADGVAALEKQPDVLRVSLDGQVDLALAESVPLIGADQVQVAGVDGTGVNVAVIDTGIDTDHPDLSDSIIGERCFLTYGTCPPAPHPAEDTRGHGTHVSGIITSNGMVASNGVAPRAGILAERVFPDVGSAQFSDVTAALDDVIDANRPTSGRAHIDLINMSLGAGIYGPGQCRSDLPAIDGAIETLFNQGALTFIASGNNGSSTGISYPACAPYAVSVGATYDAVLSSDQRPACDSASQPDQVVCFSNASDDLDLLAPGSIILSDWPSGYTVNFLSGTSMASPMALGVAALLKQALPNITPGQIVDVLKRTGIPVTDNRDPNHVRTKPRVNARAAVLDDDFDRDGCTNGKELQTAPGSQTSGGLRDPENFWDYFDTPNPSNVRDHRILVDDVTRVVNRYRANDNNGTATINRNSDPFSVPPATGYHPAFDRTAIGPNVWNLGPPDGQINVADVVAVVNQYRHDCA